MFDGAYESVLLRACPVVQLSVRAWNVLDHPRFVDPHRWWEAPKREMRPIRTVGAFLRIKAEDFRHFVNVGKKTERELLRCQEAIRRYLAEHAPSPDATSGPETAPILPPPLHPSAFRLRACAHIA